MASYVTVVVKDTNGTVGQLVDKLALSAGAASTSIISDAFQSVAHGFANGDLVSVTGTTIPTGLTATTIYYVVSAAANTFKVSLTEGGAALTISGGAAVVVNGMGNKNNLINALVDYLIGASMGNVASSQVSVTVRTSDPAILLVGTSSQQNLTQVG